MKLSLTPYPPMSLTCGRGPILRSSTFSHFLKKKEIFLPNFFLLCFLCTAYPNEGPKEPKFNALLVALGLIEAQECAGSIFGPFLAISGHFFGQK